MSKPGEYILVTCAVFFTLTQKIDEPMWYGLFAGWIIHSIFLFGCAASRLFVAGSEVKP